MPLRVRTQTRFLWREVNIQSVGVKPHAAPNSKQLRFGNLTQTQKSAIKRTRDVFGALWHGDIDV